MLSCSSFELSVVLLVLVDLSLFVLSSQAFYNLLPAAVRNHQHYHRQLLTYLSEPFYCYMISWM